MEFMSAPPPMHTHPQVTKEVKCVAANAYIILRFSHFRIGTLWTRLAFIRSCCSLTSNPFCFTCSSIHEIVFAAHRRRLHLNNTNEFDSFQRKREGSPLTLSPSATSGTNSEVPPAESSCKSRVRTSLRSSRTILLWCVTVGICETIRVAIQEDVSTEKKLSWYGRRVRHVPSKTRR